MLRSYFAENLRKSKIMIFAFSLLLSMRILTCTIVAAGFLAAKNDTIPLGAIKRASPSPQPLVRFLLRHQAASNENHHHHHHHNRFARIAHEWLKRSEFNRSNDNSSPSSGKKIQKRQTPSNEIVKWNPSKPSSFSCGDLFNRRNLISYTLVFWVILPLFRVAHYLANFFAPKPSIRCPSWRDEEPEDIFPESMLSPPCNRSISELLRQWFINIDKAVVHNQSSLASVCNQLQKEQQQHQQQQQQQQQQQMDLSAQEDAHSKRWLLAKWLTFAFVITLMIIVMIVLTVIIAPKGGTKFWRHKNRSSSSSGGGSDEEEEEIENDLRSVSSKANGRKHFLR